MSDAVDTLADLLRQAGADATFDPERNNKHPCFACGDVPMGAHRLVDLEFQDRTVTRPFCDKCIWDEKPAEVTERAVDLKSRLFLLDQLRNELEISGAYRKALEFYASRPNWTKTVMRKIPVGGGTHGLRQVNLMQHDQGDTARKALDPNARSNS